MSASRAPSGSAARGPSSPLRAVSITASTSGNGTTTSQAPSNSSLSVTTNSRRNSTPSTPSPGAGGSATKTRARDLLRKHYGLGVGPPPPKAGSSVMDPMDLNSPAFDAKSYYDQLITTSSLSGLLKRENELLSEIRQLDSDRQSLVYNHHHELIAASDTISAVKTRAESLDSDLDMLKAAFSEISRLASEVAVDVPEPQSRRSRNGEENGR